LMVSGVQTTGGEQVVAVHLHHAIWTEKNFQRVQYPGLK
jgi:hypothetical protein